MMRYFSVHLDNRDRIVNIRMDFVSSVSEQEAREYTADILKKDCEVKLLVGCTEQETEKILQFLNQTQFQKAILVRRGKEMPSWATSD